MDNCETWIGNYIKRRGTGTDGLLHLSWKIFRVKIIHFHIWKIFFPFICVDTLDFDRSSNLYEGLHIIQHPDYFCNLIVLCTSTASHWDLKRFNTFLTYTILRDDCHWYNGCIGACIYNYVASFFYSVPTYVHHWQPTFKLAACGMRSSCLDLAFQRK